MPPRWEGSRSCSPAVGWPSSRKVPSASRSRPLPGASSPQSARASPYTLAAPFAGLFLPDIVKYLPFSVANASVSTGSGGGFGGGGAQIVALDANTPLVLVVVWLIGSLVVAAVFTEQAEISG